MEDELICGNNKSRNSLDLEIALMWAYHIRHPCTIIVNGEERSLRSFYLRVSKGIVSRLTDSAAKKFLQAEIGIYEIYDKLIK